MDALVLRHRRVGDGADVWMKGEKACKERCAAVVRPDNKEEPVPSHLLCDRRGQRKNERRGEQESVHA